MTFDDILEQVIAFLKRQGRISYSALRRRFDLDDAYLEDLKDELLFSHPVVDEGGRGLVWTGETETSQAVASQSEQTPQPPTTRETYPAHEPPLESRPREAERRQLTVMFSDLVDSTKLSGQLDPEEYREVLRAYQSTCSEVIHRFDGYIAQHLGDALLVYFGYPHAHEDDAQRAVRTGLGMLDAMKTLNERLEREKGIRLAIRVGIHTGLTVISDVGSGQKHEMLALGEAPNVASRIQGLAAPNMIAISAATFHLVEGYFTCQDLGEYSLKGIAEPVHVYRIFGESGAQSRLDVASTRGLTPLVGREQEVGLLLERWNQTKDGAGQVVLLSGEGGIGKSRLVQVLKDHVAEEAHTRWECRSSPYFQNSALYPMTDLLQRTLRFQANDTPEEKLGKLEQELSPYRLPLEETVPLFAPLLSLSIPEDHYPPLNLSPQRQRQKTLESIVAILLQQMEQQPVLFILEDLHWLDPTSLELLNLLIDQIPTASICVLLTCRPEFQPTWTHRSYLTGVTLSRLSRDQIASIATQVAGGKPLPDEVIEQLVERTDGVPLYIEEMTKSVLESSVLKDAGGQYELTGPISSLAIPATLQDSLMARLDRLVTAKAVAQYASVIGRQFSYELLQAVSQLDESTLQRELGRLVEAELVYQRGLPPHATYIFKHALIQDIAYESLLRSARQGYHRRIAAVLEQRYSETAEAQLELLAYHFTEAGLNEQATHYWYQAGQTAIERSANVEAISHLKTGLKLLLTLPETPARLQQELDMQVTLGSALMVTLGTGAPEVKSVYDRARQLCGKVSETPQLFPVIMGLCLYYSTCGVYQTAQELGMQLLSLAQRQNDAACLLSAHTVLSSTYLFTGEFASAYTHLEQALGIADAGVRDERLVDSTVSPRVQCRNYCSIALWSLGYPERARQHSLEACHLAQELGHLPSLSQALHYTANLHLRRREAAAVWERSDSLLTLSREQGFAQYAAFGRGYRGWALAMQGNVEEGIASLHQALAEFRHLELMLPQIAFRLLLTDVYREAGHVEQGWRAIAEAKALMAEVGHHHGQSELSHLEGELWMAQADTQKSLAEAEKHFLHALDTARSQQAKSLELRAATSLAKLWQRQGKRQDAYDLLAPVYNWFIEGLDTADLKDAKALLDALG